MKKIFKTILTITLFTGLVSCEDEQDLYFLSPEGSFEILTPDTNTTIVLSDATPTNTAVTLTWQPISYGTPTEVTYTVQFAANGTEFSEPVNITSTSTTYYSMNVADLNAKALELGLIPQIEGAIDVRIRSSVGSGGSEESFSNAITLLVTPYNAIVAKRELFLVGAATAAGWNNNSDNVPLFRDPNNDDLYYFTGYFTSDGGDGGQFKVLEVKGQWQPQWGTNDGSTLAVNDGTGSDPGTFSVPAPGYYTFVFNIGDLTFSLTPFTGNTGNTYPTIGIIGDATSQGWDASTPMTVNFFDPHLWKINTVLNNGFMKFRANDSWDVNWGSNTELSGLATNGGPDIPVAAGEYDIWFNSLDGRYLLIPIQ